MSEESKFKVGDKVKVIESNNTDGWFCIDKGDILGTVEIVVGRGSYRVKIGGYKGIYDNDCFAFSDKHLELIASQEHNEQGVKYDLDKPEASLIPKGVLTKVINVLGFGSKKYAKDNWQKVDNPKERYYNAAQRHINQWWEGEKYDSETGENHLAHAICCLMFMLWFDIQEDKEINK